MKNRQFLTIFAVLLALFNANGQVSPAAEARDYRAELQGYLEQRQAAQAEIERLKAQVVLLEERRTAPIRTRAALQSVRNLLANLNQNQEYALYAQIPNLDSITRVPHILLNFDTVEDIEGVNEWLSENYRDLRAMNPERFNWLIGKMINSLKNYNLTRPPHSFWDPRENEQLWNTLHNVLYDQPLPEEEELLPTYEDVKAEAAERAAREAAFVAERGPTPAYFPPIPAPTAQTEEPRRTQEAAERERLERRRDMNERAQRRAAFKRSMQYAEPVGPEEGGWTSYVSPAAWARWFRGEKQ